MNAIPLTTSPVVLSCQRPARVSRGMALLLFLAFTVVFKLLLVANEEIIARDLPHDDLWQVNAAQRSYWGGDYQQYTMLHLPVYPLYIKAVSLLGVPLRLATDLLYCATACLLSTALWRAGFGTIVAGLAGAVAIMHPASFQLPNRCGPEVLLTPLLMGAVAVTLNWWIKRDDGSRAAVWAAVWWALAWNTRQESILLAAGLAVLAACIVCVDRRKPLDVVGREIFWGAALPVMAALALSAAIKSANYWRWGIFSDSVITSRGYVAAYKALQSIPPERHLDFIPISRDMREKAYAISPAFAELRPHLEGSIGAGWARISRESFTDGLGMKNLGKTEVAAGWFYWALLDAAKMAGHGSNPAIQDSFFQRVSDEIRAAQAKGELGARFVPIAMIDPAVGLWINRIPHSFESVAATLVMPVVVGRTKQIAAENDLEGSLFDEQTNRRTHLVAEPQGQLAGWANAMLDQVIAISLVSPGGHTAAIIAPSVIRQDIDAKIPTGFVLVAKDITPSDWQGGKVSIQLATHGIVEYPIADLVPGKVAVQKAGNVLVGLGVDSLAPPSTSEPWAWKLQVGWERLFYRTVKWANWGLGLFGFALGYRIWRKRAFDGKIVIICFLISIIFFRVCFFALLDATSWPGNQPRYLYPIMPLHVFVLILVYAHLVKDVLAGLPSLFQIFTAWNLKRKKILDKAITRTS